MAAKFVYGPAEAESAAKINSAKERMDALGAYAQQPGLDPASKAQVLQERLALKSQIDSYAAARMRAAEGLTQYYEPKLRERLVERSGIDDKINTAKLERNKADVELQKAVASLNLLEPEINALLDGTSSLKPELQEQLQDELTLLQQAIATQRETIAAKEGVLRTEGGKKREWQRRYGRAAEKLDLANKIKAEGGTVDTLAEQKRRVASPEIQTPSTSGNKVVDFAQEKAKRADGIRQDNGTRTARSTETAETGISRGEAARVLLSLLEASEQRESLRDTLQNIVSTLPGGEKISGEEGQVDIGVLAKAWNKYAAGGNPKVPDADINSLKRLTDKDTLNIVDFGVLLLGEDGMKDELITQGVTRLAKTWTQGFMSQTKLAA